MSDPMTPDPDVQIAVIVDKPATDQPTWHEFYKPVHLASRPTGTAATESSGGDTPVTTTTDGRWITSPRYTVSHLLRIRDGHLRDTTICGQRVRGQIIRGDQADQLQHCRTCTRANLSLINEPIANERPLRSHHYG